MKATRTRTSDPCSLRVVFSHHLARRRGGQLQRTISSPPSITRPTASPAPFGTASTLERAQNSPNATSVGAAPGNSLRRRCAHHQPRRAHLREPADRLGKFRRRRRVPVQDHDRRFRHERASYRPDRRRLFQSARADGARLRHRLARPRPTTPENSLPLDPVRMARTTSTC